MRRLILSLAAVLVVSVAVATIGRGQYLFGQGRGQAPALRATESSGPGRNAVLTAQSAQSLLRNGLDYIRYERYDRALEFLHEAEQRIDQLSPIEVGELRRGLETARARMDRPSNAPVAESYAIDRRPQAGSFIAAPVDRQIVQTAGSVPSNSLNNSAMNTTGSDDFPSITDFDQRVDPLHDLPVPDFNAVPQPSSNRQTSPLSRSSALSPEATQPDLDGLPNLISGESNDAQSSQHSEPVVPFDEPFSDESLPDEPIIVAMPEIDDTFEQLLGPPQPNDDEPTLPNPTPQQRSVPSDPISEVFEEPIEVDFDLASASSPEYDARIEPEPRPVAPAEPGPVVIELGPSPDSPPTRSETSGGLKPMVIALPDPVPSRRPDPRGSEPTGAPVSDLPDLPAPADELPESSADRGTIAEDLGVDDRLEQFDAELPPLPPARETLPIIPTPEPLPDQPIPETDNDAFDLPPLPLTESPGLDGPSPRPIPEFSGVDSFQTRPQVAPSAPPQQQTHPDLPNQSFDRSRPGTLDFGPVRIDDVLEQRTFAGGSVSRPDLDLDRLDSRRLSDDEFNRQLGQLGRLEPSDRIAQIEPGLGFDNAPPLGFEDDFNTEEVTLPRAPSPTEPRPILGVTIPEDFDDIPVTPRRFQPFTKYWAAAATAHFPLYFQDAVLERYGQTVEQTLGPAGRVFTYPIDDPRQSKNRGQILQPVFSAGLMAAQVLALPYRLVVDPPWEAEYDLGYYRPGDPIPPDTYYFPIYGVGPPLQGNNH